MKKKYKPWITKGIKNLLVYIRDKLLKEILCKENKYFEENKNTCRTMAIDWYQ